VLRARREGRVLHAREHRGLRLPVTDDRSRTVDAARVWEEFHASLLGFIARRVRDRDTAEDILQEVMLRIHRHAGELDSPSAIGAWVHQIARNAITDHYRRAASRREQPAGLDLDRVPLPAEPEPDLARSEIAACLRPLLDELTPSYREAIGLTELDGLTQTEAAAQLGMSTSGMKSRVQRGRAQLKELLVECCVINLDRRARITSYQPRGGSCGCQTASPDASPSPAGPMHRRPDSARPSSSGLRGQGGRAHGAARQEPSVAGRQQAGGVGRAADVRRAQRLVLDPQADRRRCRASSPLLRPSQS
jgi:RNA polymerase sigma-70 factor (ECF subfamily)